MRTAYRVLALLIPILVALQAAFVSLAMFGVFSWVDDGHRYTDSVAESGTATGAAGVGLHSLGAMVIAVVAIVLLVVSFFAKVAGGVRWALLILLDVVVQWALAFASFDVPVVGLLHGLNAFLLFGLCMMAATRAGRTTAVPDARSG